MDNTSVWVGTSPAVSFPPMAGDVEADAAVIGGGITGITTALLLSQAGLSVVVVEALRVGQGTTGYSTGNLYATLDDLLYRVRDAWDEETSAAVARSRGEAVDWLERTAADQGIACGFVRCPQFLYPVEPGQLEDMRKEFDAVRAAGLEVSVVTDAPLPGWKGEALRIEGQAQFQPYAFVHGLARRISSDRCRIFENTKALEIDGDKGVVVTTGGTVRARAIFMATHMPKGFTPVQTVLGPYREYGVAAPFEGYFPPGIYWTLEDPGHSVRLHEDGGVRYLVAIGEKHKTGQPEPGRDYYGAVEDYARAQFGLTRFSHRWSAQHYRPADKLPYIGRAAGSDNVYLATGFGTNGLVYGALAARIVADAILQRENPWRDLYNSTRFTPAKSLPDFARENANSAAQYARDYLTSADTVELADIAPGQGGLARVAGDKLAVYRREDGNYVAMSPVCPHLGCIVHWNAAERTWDCPCHGSRFRCDGEVLEGPAIKALERKDLAAE